MTSASTVSRATDPALARTIPSLDGIRALAVLCVIWGHGAATLPQTDVVVFLRANLPGGYFGVQAFFVLSGFLITTLLLRERGKTGRISLSAFYRRRAYRILPALFVFLAVVSVLAVTRVIDGLGPRDIISPALFLRDYWPLDGSWWTGHIWSLSVEEQFYVLWPLAVILMPRRVAVKVLVIGVLISPFVRIGTYLLPFVPEGGVTYMFHTRADALMIGSPLAKAEEAPGRGTNWGMAAPSPTLPRGTRIKVGTTGSLERILLGPAHVTDGSENLVGALRQSMAALGARSIRQMQAVEMVYAPSTQTEGKSWQRAR